MSAIMFFAVSMITGSSSGERLEAYPPAHLVPGHDRHHDVQEHQVDGVVPVDDIEGADPVRGRFHDALPRFEIILNDPDVHRVVIDDKEHRVIRQRRLRLFRQDRPGCPASFTAVSASSMLSMMTAPGSSGAGSSDTGRVKENTEPPSFPGRHTDRAVMQLYDLFRYGKPQARAGIRARIAPVDLPVGFEYLSPCTPPERRSPCPTRSPRSFRPLPASWSSSSRGMTRADSSIRPFIGELDGVADKIAQHLPYAVLIGMHRGEYPARCC